MNVASKGSMAAWRRNRLLANVPEEELEPLAEHVDVLSLGQKQHIVKGGEPFAHAYFPLSGVISMVIEMQDGGIVEVATVGNEGMVGIALVLGAEKSSTTTFAQIPGEAARIKAAPFLEHLERAPRFSRVLHRYAQSLMSQISYTAACNHAHEIEQRACRWLLMMHDRVGQDEFPLTQEFLAQMLGVRRPSVTVVAGMLQKAGLIRYTRGHITVLNRPGLEAATCECYHLVKREQDSLVGG